MDAQGSIEHLRSVLPKWQLSLNDLLTKIATRQLELSRCPDVPTTRSVRPQGSTESLRPAAQNSANGNDEPINDDTLVGNTSTRPLTSLMGKNSAQESPVEAKAREKPIDAVGPALIAGVEQITRQSNHASSMSHAQTRRPAHRSPVERKSATIGSSGSGPSEYRRTRSMIIVYYDSAVQEAFEVLVREIATARNNIRKGKMAARMKALSSAMGPNSSASGLGGSAMTKLAYSRGARPRPGEQKTAHDIIDSALEVSQATCETAAHQFLRDGDCSTEIAIIRKKLNEVDTLAKKEAEKFLTAKTPAPQIEGRSEDQDEIGNAILHSNAIEPMAVDERE